jgi:2-oxoglutarate dehydrogenase E2 component (dihydrolipoamide succinyltransferase)
MPLELKVPEVGESISEVQIGVWKRKEGESVAVDDTIVEIESDKATVELLAPAAGMVTKILKGEGERARVGEVIGFMEAVTAGDRAHAAPPSSSAPESSGAVSQPPRVMPAAARVLAEAGLPASAAVPTGPGGRIGKQDAVIAAQRAIAQPGGAPIPASAAPPAGVPAVRSGDAAGPVGRGERAVLMSPIRRRIAERLVEAQQEAALLTTFNEVDMSAVMALRAKFKDTFQERYGVKLGFMSFFVKAAVESLRAIPQVNAEFRDPHIVYHDYCDIGIAVGGGKGLVVPVLRNAESMSFARIEQAIGDFARRAGENKLKLEELQGGTFTISNGGVYGSMLSTPIINPPQSGILGLHAIQERPVAVNGQVVIRPMMYLALTYDHRIVDGREAVSFLKRVKDTIEDPSRLMLEV